jgi:uridylate kinase
MTRRSPAYKRILLKLSGEALLGSQKQGIDSAALSHLARLVQELVALGVQVGVVLGGGNIFRGAKESAQNGIARVPADQIGMLATLINGIALQQALGHLGTPARLFSALPCGAIAEPYSPQAANAALDAHAPAIFAGGTGNPYFTTDSAAALRALETGAEILIKATKVDGVYSADPALHPHATRYTTVTYTQVLEKNLQVMDGAAIALCRDNRLPILVLNIFLEDALKRAIYKQPIGTLVEGT